MERKFKITIGEKTFVVNVEEVTEIVSVTPTPSKVPAKPPVAQRQPETPTRVAPQAVTPTPSGEGMVRAPMPAVVLSIKCKVGDKVNAGDLLLTVEAMKMENNIYAPRVGVVKRIVVSEKQSVKYGDILVEIG